VKSSLIFVFGFAVRDELTSSQPQNPMKIWKDLVLVAFGILLVLTYLNCAKKGTSSVEQVSDGYVFTANEESFKNVQDNSDYAITFVSVGGRKTVDRDVINNALSDRSKYSMLEGKAKRLGTNQLKLITDSKIGIDLTQAYATFWGLNSKQVRELASGVRGASDSCGSCGGIPDMVQVTCTDPASVLCCNTCK
jgi:hypothetical protein